MVRKRKNADGKHGPERSETMMRGVSSTNPTFVTSSERVDSFLWFATACLFFSAGVGTGGWVASIPRICRDFTLTPAALGAGLPAIAGGALCATLFVPAIVRRVGAARASAVCIVLFMLAVIGPTMMGGFPMLLLPFLALGVTNGATDICINAYASGVERSGPRPLMSSFHAAQTVGMLAGVGLGGAIAGLGGTTAIGAIGAACVMGMSLTAAMLIMSKQHQFRHEAATPSIAASMHQATSAQRAPSALPGASQHLSPSTFTQRCAVALKPISMRSALKAMVAIPGGVLVLGAGLGAASLLQNGAADWSGVYCVNELGMTEALSGSGFGCLLVAIALSRVMGDALVARWGPIVLIRGGALLIATGYFIVLLAPSIFSVCLGFAIVGLGLGNLNPVIFGLLGRVTSHPARAISMAMAINYVFAMSGPVVIGFMAQQYGLRQAFLCLVVAAILVATVLAASIKRTGVARSGP